LEENSEKEKYLGERWKGNQKKGKREFIGREFLKIVQKMSLKEGRKRTTQEEE
jgi:hypothetical protein